VKYRPNCLPEQANAVQVTIIDDPLNHGGGEGEAWGAPWKKTYKTKIIPSKIPRVYKL